MFVNPEKAQKIIAACCLLHNFMMKENKEGYCPAGFSDTFDDDGNLIPGTFRQVLPENSLFHAASLTNPGGRPISNVTEQRDHLKTFFNSAEGELNWQLHSIFLSNKN